METLINNFNGMDSSIEIMVAFFLWMVLVSMFGYTTVKLFWLILKHYLWKS